MLAKKRIPLPMGKDSPAYRELWRVVDGAVADAFNMHPEYLSAQASPRVVRRSINKRVVGALLASREGGAASKGS